MKQDPKPFEMMSPSEKRAHVESLRKEATTSISPEGDDSLEVARRLVEGLPE